MAAKYFGPGGQTVMLGSETDKWAGINAKNATIDSFKNVGSTTTPVYFDTNGVPKPATSIENIKSVPWKIVTDKPSTLTGYGITDAQSAINFSIIGGQLCITYDE